MIIDDLAIFLKKSITLRHLDISGLALGGNLAKKLTKNGFVKSRSLLAIHLA